MTESCKLFAIHDSGYGLKSLTQWNNEREQYWVAVRERVQHPELFINGLKCPKCLNGDLYDTGRVLSTGPTMLQVKCGSCNAKDKRYE